jgi:hypothetical protein
MLSYWARDVRHICLAAQQRTHAEELDRVRRSLRRAGRAVPTRTLGLRDLDQLREGFQGRPTVPRRRRMWPDDECASAAKGVLRGLKGRVPSNNEWRDLTYGRPDIPSYSRLNKLARAMGMTFMQLLETWQTELQADG